MLDTSNYLYLHYYNSDILMFKKYTALSESDSSKNVVKCIILVYLEARLIGIQK